MVSPEEEIRRGKKGTGKNSEQKPEIVLRWSCGNSPPYRGSPCGAWPGKGSPVKTCHETWGASEGLAAPCCLPPEGERGHVHTFRRVHNRIISPEPEKKLKKSFQESGELRPAVSTGIWSSVRSSSSLTVSGSLRYSSRCVPVGTNSRSSAYAPIRLQAS